MCRRTGLPDNAGVAVVSGKSRLRPADTSGLAELRYRRLPDLVWRAELSG